MTQNYTESYKTFTGIISADFDVSLIKILAF